MELTITHRHCKDTHYHILSDDGMMRALKQQYPALQVKKVLADQFRDKQNNLYTFDTSNETGYNSIIATQLKWGKIKERTIQITMEPSPG